jgi:hypothetical protein
MAFERELGRWFSHEALEPHPDPLGADPVTYRRQMNMALALAASKWLELGRDEPRMRAWIARTEARAEARRAAARAEAMRLAARWLDD